MARHPTNGRGRNSTWITVHRLRCTVRRFDDQRGYFCNTVRHPCTCEDGKDNHSLSGRQNHRPNGRLLCGRRKKVFAWGTNKMVPSSLREIYNLFTAEGEFKSKYCIEIREIECQGTILIRRRRLTKHRWQLQRSSLQYKCVTVKYSDNGAFIHHLKSPVR